LKSKPETPVQLTTVNEMNCGQLPTSLRIPNPAIFHPFISQNPKTVVTAEKLHV
jgi:hypothetical protein